MDTRQETDRLEGIMETAICGRGESLRLGCWKNFQWWAERNMLAAISISSYIYLRVPDGKASKLRLKLA